MNVLREVPFEIGADFIDELLDKDYDFSIEISKGDKTCNIDKIGNAVKFSNLNDFFTELKNIFKL